MKNKETDKNNITRCGEFGFKPKKEKNMARKENMADVQEDLGVFSINETSVGIGGNNRKRTDVQLIQFFLMQFYFEHEEMFDGRVPKTKQGSPIIKIDGICGRQTEMGIWHHQQYITRSGFPIRVDGLVSVARAVVSPFGGEVYTIHSLNNWFRLNANGKEFHGKLEDHPNIIQFAPELRSELAAAQVGDKF